MKLIIVAPPAFPVSRSTGSSVEISLYQIAKRLAKDQDVTILSRKTKSLPKISTNGKLRIVRFPPQSYVQNIIRYLKKSKFDILQVENRPQFVPILRKHFPRARIILVLHSLTFMAQLSKQAKRLVIQSANAVICNSHFIRNYYRTLFSSMASKFKTIHLGVDLTRFRPPSQGEKTRQQNQYGLKISNYHLLFAGRIISGKGVHLLIQAASILRKTNHPIQVVIIGRCRSSYCKFLQSLAKKLRVPVKFIGAVSPSLMHKAYWLGDCFVCPTQFREAFGLVNVEAMASGLPVVASRRGGIIEIINQHNGILVSDYRNSKAFAKAIEKLIQSTSLSKKLMKAGEATVKKRFSWVHTAAKYQQFYLHGNV
ncbi:MAG TPA: glycosyltransferase family 4 protein [Bacillota bacterium]|nr:glycosyltransferase family 4 protein [Bacillota bacterium]